jgi:outer membrane protein TolC
MKKMITIAMAVLVTAVAYSQNILSLEQSKDMAIKNNIKIKNGKLETDAAREEKKNAFTNYFPKVSLNALGVYGINPLIQFGNINLVGKAVYGQLNIAEPVYVGGKIRTGNKLAKIGVDVKTRQEQLIENETLLKTEQEYWQIVSLQEKQNTLVKYEALLNDLNKQVDDSYKAGLIIKNDVLKVQIKQSELQANKSKLNTGKRLALMQFCQTINIPFDSTLTLGDDLENLKLPATYYVDADTALPLRTEYYLLETSVKAQKLQTQLKKGDYMPQVAAGVSGYYYNLVEKGLDGTTNGLAFATVSIPISDWWGGTHAIKEEKLKEKIAENNLSDTKGLLKLQMEKAWGDLQEAYTQILIMEETSRQTAENLKVNQTSYQSGVVTLSDLLEAQTLQKETADKLIEAKTQYKTAITTYLQCTAR